MLINRIWRILKCHYSSCYHVNNGCIFHKTFIWDNHIFAENCENIILLLPPVFAFMDWNLIRRKFLLPSFEDIDISLDSDIYSPKIILLPPLFAFASLQSSNVFPAKNRYHHLHHHHLHHISSNWLGFWYN